MTLTDTNAAVFQRTRLTTFAATLLAFGGGLAILYAGFLSIPPFSDVPVPLAMQALGVVGLAAAVGVFLRQAWGRALGVAVVVIDLALAVLRVAAQASGPNALNVFADLAMSVVLPVIVSWVLLRRWPKQA
jgi:hypothetical protein